MNHSSRTFVYSNTIVSYIGLYKWALEGLAGDFIRRFYPIVGGNDLRVNRAIILVTGIRAPSHRRGCPPKCEAQKEGNI